MSEMTELWTALADHAAPAFSSWADPDIASLQRRLIAGVGGWWQHLERAPRTLIHHDFNPRNVCLRDGVLCAYDWELAAIGAPQRDLAEFLCFVLSPDCSVEEVAGWIERHRRALACETSTSIDHEAWREGFRAALYDLLINRLSTYAMVHRIRPQSFLPRVLRTWRALYEVPPTRGPRMSSASPAAAFHRANTLTYLSLLAGVMAIATSLGDRSAVSGALIALAVIADTFDGRFARRFVRSPRNARSASNSTASRMPSPSGSRRASAWQARDRAARCRSPGGW